MGALGALGGLGAVGDFLGERMLEGVLDLGEEHLLEDQIASAERANGVFQLRLGNLADPLEDRLREALADDRRGLQKAPLALGKPIDARRQQRLDRRRYAELGDGPDQPIRPAPALQAAPLDQRLDDLLDEERIAAGVVLHELGETAEARVPAGRAGSGTPRKSKTKGNVSSKRGSISISVPAIFCRAPRSPSCSVRPNTLRRSSRRGRNGSSRP